MPQSAKSKAKARGLECNSTQTETERTIPPASKKRITLHAPPAVSEARRKRPCESVLQNLRAGTTESLGERPASRLWYRSLQFMCVLV